jgi:transposase-like protein
LSYSAVEELVAQLPELERRQAPAAPPPDARDDVWYWLLLSTYSQRAATSRRAGVELAREYGVPTTTLHRWLKEARRRLARYERERDRQAAENRQVIEEARSAAAAEKLSLDEWMKRLPGWISMLEEEDEEADPEVWLLDNLDAWSTTTR